MASPASPVASQGAVGHTLDGWIEQAQALQASDRLDEAEQILAQVIEAAPGFSPALHQGAILSFKRKRPEEAIERLKRAIALAPNEPLLHRNICEIYRVQKHIGEAAFHGGRAVELSPDDASAHYNLGVVHYDRLEIDAAIACTRKALALDPTMAEAHFELAEALLVSGQFEEGWKEYEWRFDLPNAPALLPGSDLPLWGGGAMSSGTLMLIADQGFGDTIQFCRYIPQVARLCPNLIVAGSADMRPIIMQQGGILGYFDRWEHMPAFDAYCSLSGLPRLFGTDLATIPASAAYVKADPDKVAHWRARIEALAPKGCRRIGLVWAGRPTHGNDFNRSTTLATLDPIAALDGVVLISLQMGAATAEIGRYYGHAPLINLGAEIRDFTDTMAILHCLDHLVAVDTGVAHLAGAMGLSTSILVPYAPDWRWLLTRRDTPWYPSVRLFRQATPGSWQEPVLELAAQLRRTPGRA